LSYTESDKNTNGLKARKKGTFWRKMKGVRICTSETVQYDNSWVGPNSSKEPKKIREDQTVAGGK